MKNQNRSFFFLLLSLVLISCEKEIDIELPAAERKIVVEGHIEQGAAPYVILTRSSGYFDPVDSAAIFSTIVNDAIVIVSDGTNTDTLVQTTDLNLFPPIVYKAPNPTVIGQVGGTYSLRIESGGQVLTSSTTIPQLLALDSIWFKLQPPSDSLGFIWAHMTEPAGEMHAYRWFAKRIGKDADFVPPMSSVFDDKFIDGKSFDFAYDRGSKPNSDAADDNNDERGYFKEGDLIVIKFCTIDRQVFEFFHSYEIAMFSNGNPFASPAQVESNIEGGLGVWGGYGFVLDTVLAQ